MWQADSRTPAETAAARSAVPGADRSHGRRLAVDRVTRRSIFTKTGNGPLTVSLIEIVDDFVYGDIVPSHVTINPQSTKEFQVWFTPTTAGAHQGWLRVLSDAPGSPHSVPLTGVGVP